MKRSIRSPRTLGSPDPWGDRFLVRPDSRALMRPVSGLPQVASELGNRGGKDLAFADEKDAGFFFGELRRV